MFSRNRIDAAALAVELDDTIGSLCGLFSGNAVDTTTLDICWDGLERSGLASNYGSLEEPSLVPSFDGCI